MSRCRVRAPTDICADCGASDPSWASINRGILLCMECCSVHRSMGRHISHVKSLHQGTWPPSLLAMINALTTQNVNGIWEHSLLDPTASKHLRRKPQPKDSLNSVKSDFIQAKHRKLAYVFRPRRDDVPCNATELSRQLHSSVRSSNLDTSLRLLVQGADPNYFNHEKGTSCLHVACRTGNVYQAELLVAWGADPNAKDLSGNTPASSARLGGHFELADRMVELVYEVTDRLSYHLCNKKPDHLNGQHYIGFDKIESHEMTDVAKAARGKLQLLPNHLFEELIMDIYDEVDRRECEAVWVTSAMGLERFGVAFLPVNPALSAPRNQGRQKLARLSASEMAALLRDILMDASRRQHIATLKPNSMSSLSQKGHTKLNYLKQMTHLSDDEPLYDSVASDDDYAALVPSMSKENKDPSSPKMGETVSKHYEANMPLNDSFPMQNIANVNNEHQNNISSGLNVREIEQLFKQINMKDSTIEELKSELKQLQSVVENLKIENVLLKNSADKRSSVVSSNSPPTRDMSSPQICSPKMEKENNGEYHSDDLLLEVRTLGRSNQRPNSMYEARERPKFNWNVTKQQVENSIAKFAKKVLCTWLFAIFIAAGKGLIP
ncbi:ARF GTPase-activating protein GIT1 isoform X2 [Arctopsyche grandis]|uniref:ARF GTPase-activating protein GIT1 isoform X2 n=1 Tax=Arctopsyche grandis TaxID=121162 RepID=UPI00406D9DB7